MTTAETLLVNSGILGILILALALFINNKVWPWYTTVYWPKTTERQDQQTSLINNIYMVLTRIAETEGVKNEALSRLLTMSIENHENISLHARRMDDVEDDLLTIMAHLAQMQGNEVLMPIGSRKKKRIPRDNDLIIEKPPEDSIS